MTSPVPADALEGLLIEGRRAPPEEYDRVQVTRRGEPKPAGPGMALEEGDRVRTGAGVTALLTLASGYELVLEPETEVTIGDEETVLGIGKLIAKRIRDAVKRFGIGTRFVSAGVEGTEFVIEVDPESTVRIAVLEGQVRVAPKGAQWQPALFNAGEAGVIRPNAAPERTPGLDQGAIDAMRARSTQVEEVLRKTGALRVIGTGAERYGIYDSTGTVGLADARTNDARELLPGTYVVKLGNRNIPVRIRAGQTTTIR